MPFGAARLGALVANVTSKVNCRTGHCWGFTTSDRGRFLRGRHGRYCDLQVKRKNNSFCKSWTGALQ